MKPIYVITCLYFICQTAQIIVSVLAYKAERAKNGKRGGMYVR